MNHSNFATTRQFFQSLFPHTLTGQIQLVRINDVQDWGDGGERQYISVGDLHNDELPLPLDLSAKEADFYFTPHTFKTTLSGTKENSSTRGQVVWIESDDSTLKAAHIQEARPTWVVTTSPGHNHFYWVLSRPIPIEDVEAINRALTYKYCATDKSGWDIGQLMRIPYTYNNKYRNERYQILPAESSSMGQVDPEAFDTLERVSPEALSTYEMPSDGEFPAHDVLWRSIEPHIPKTLHDLCTKQSPDRSTALWRLYNEAFRFKLTKEETFTLARHSRNNKFADQRYNSDQALWRDLCGCYELHISRRDLPILGQIESIKHDKTVPADLKRVKIGELLVRDLAVRGPFLFDQDGREAYHQDHSTRELLSISARSSDTAMILQQRYDILEGTDDFRILSSYLRNAVEGMRDRHVTLRTNTFFNTQEGVLYISNHDGRTWRLEPDLQKEPVIIENGVDDVFFRPHRRAQGFTPDWSTAVHGTPLLDELIFSLPNFDEHLLSKSEAQFLVKAWVYALFFAEAVRDRPILCITGTKGSGKSTLFRVINQLLLGGGDLRDMPADEARFKETVRDTPYIFFDGVDQPFRELPNVLSLIATGTEDKVRVFYKDNEFAHYRLHAFVGLSTMDATRFMRDDVADRSIILNVERLPSFKSPTEILDAVDRSRNKLWGELITDLHRVAAALPDVELDTIKLRMADFARVLAALCNVYKKDVNIYLKVLLRAQNESIIASDPVYEVLDLWLRKPENRSRRIALKALFLELTQYALPGSPFHRYITSSSKLSAHIRKIRDNIIDTIVMEDVSNASTSYYQFTPTDELLRRWRLMQEAAQEVSLNPQGSMSQLNLEGNRYAV
jgi:hypothetical protein